MAFDISLLMIVVVRSEDWGKFVATALKYQVDLHVGRRIRLRRTLLGMSQEQLGSAMELTFQQIQKYERGANRISSGRLYKLSKVLDVPLSYFFVDLEGADVAELTGAGAKGQAEFEDSMLLRRETIELVRAYFKIEDSTIRKQLYDMVRAAANVD